MPPKDDKPALPIDNAPTRAAIRLHCIDLAVRGALLTGRAGNFVQQADMYFDWVMKPAEETPAE
jgi:hypothetical protein